MYLSAGLAIIAYLICTFTLLPQLLQAQSGGEKATIPKRSRFIISSAVALLLHGVFIQQLFVVGGDGLNFTLLNILNLMTLLIVLLVTMALSHLNTLWFLLPMVYSFAIIGILVGVLIPGHVVAYLQDNTALLIHITLALLSYAVCFIALLYVFQLNWLDKKLKSKKVVFSPMIPSLMSVERQFFKILCIGELLLTLALLSGALSLHNFFAPEQIQKAIFSFLAWIVFGLLLIGHRKLHWRGKRVLIYTISGMILLTIAYFGSRTFLTVL
ncbi:cytochrome C assembly family protein [Testudinibacter sp. TR-2022]|uniref:cytochrome C assembly family protein n=1 Tax=Testudinibacter sp. TR-2022 TaxID=2585029 RepID=UPI0011187970|nr:cytochrome c biogenesis protein CcsA [Testudinibacter sp. TR-2022]TNH08088.1 inner membrane protein YpjD [Pasteurellaceae bacterium Phil11]TNH24178.1 inner membrane protein YpjD [Testudinibacter sp. TR-2022]TNH24578.1 inner membrane protein YpjD [Testudinibacter sp. TR-2022]